MGKVSHFGFTIPIWQCQPIGFYHPRHEHGKPFSFITPTMGKTILFLPRPPWARSAIFLYQSPTYFSWQDQPCRFFQTLMGKTRHFILH
jgi:hypothetical protein